LSEILQMIFFLMGESGASRSEGSL